jgi:predicted RNA binding protein YcfA (HicA-like mRNA interferase family)
LTRLPVLSGQELVKALEKMGYEVDRQKGSHIVLRHREPPHRRLTVPDHKELRKGTLRAILRHSGISVDELVDLLR